MEVLDFVPHNEIDFMCVHDENVAISYDPDCLEVGLDIAFMLSYAKYTNCRVIHSAYNQFISFKTREGHAFTYLYCPDTDFKLKGSFYFVSCGGAYIYASYYKSDCERFIEQYATDLPKYGCNIRECVYEGMDFVSQEEPD